MPINIASYLQPRNATNPDPALRGTYYLVEDLYLKGGFQVRDNATERDGINELNRKKGMFVLTADDQKLWVLQEDLLTWSEFKSGSGSGGTPVRSVAIQPLLTVAGAAYENFELDLGKTVMLLGLKVDVPCIVEIHSTIDRADTNPYKFIANNNQLEDDGTTIMSDGTIVKGRRFSILSNMEDPVSSKHYVKVVNQKDVMIQPTLTFIYLPLE